MSADSPRRTGDNVKQSRGTIVTPQVVSDRSILDSAIGFINEVTLAHPIQTDTKNTIAWARFETAADISDPRFSDDWESDSDVGCGGGNFVVPPLLLILGYNVGAQVWAIPNNGEAVEVLSWRHGIVTNLRMLPTPTLPTTVDEHERADESLDAFADQRPLMALVESSSGNSSAMSGSLPQFCTVIFISLRTGAQVKTLKYKNAVIDILVNRSSIVITFHECLAILDANSLEDRWSINTCYPSPCINPNPVALGSRWLAYAQHKLFNSKRSGGGWDGEALASYTSTVLNAAKSLGKGLRDLGGQVAAGLTGSSAGAIKSNFSDTQSGDSKQPGVVTIIDIMEKRQILQHDISGGNTAGNSSSPSSSCSSDLEADGPAKIAHFIAHSEPIAAMELDYSGMLLLTADRRGHDFHVFRIQPHPLSSALSAVHHLYVLHRGDTSAKVQNITFSLDSRWVAVSTLRGTTHVFPIAPYGGIIGARSHGSYRVVNQMSNYLRSAGLPADERSDSPVAHTESTYPYPNRTMPPFPRPLVIAPLAQLRQPFALDSPPRSASLGSSSNTSNTGTQRQRLSSLSDDNGKPLSICAIFAESRSWLLDPPNVDETSQRVQRKALDSLFVMAGHGALIQYDLDTKVPSTVSKEWNDAPIELVVEAKAQWNLAQRKEGPQEVIPPLPSDNWLLRSREPVHMSGIGLSDRNADTESGSDDEAEDRREPWLSQVERTTYMGPGRRLWMGPQFSFWTYEEPSGSTLSDKDFDRDFVDIDKCEVKSTSATAALTAIGPIMEGRSSPLNMSGNRASPLQMTACSWSSLEPSPKLERLRHDSDSSVSETSAFMRNNARIKEEMAEAMKESTSNTSQGDQTCLSGECYTAITITDNAPFYDALTDNNDDMEEQDNLAAAAHKASVAALANALPNIHSYEAEHHDPHQQHQQDKQQQQQHKLQKIACELNDESNFSIEKIINPLGIVTTVTRCLNNEPIKTDKLDEVVSQLVGGKTIIHENYDERLFRPVVTIFYDEKKNLQKLSSKCLDNSNNVKYQNNQMDNIVYKPSELITNKLIVPVLAKEMDEEINKREKQKRKSLKMMLPKEQKQQQQEHKQQQQQLQRFEELSSFNKTPADNTRINRNKKEEVQNDIKGNRESDFTNVPLEHTNQYYNYDKMEEINISRNNGRCPFNTEEKLQKSMHSVAIDSTNTAISKKKFSNNNLDNPDNDISPIKSDHLNVKDLADSLIEIKEEKRKLEELNAIKDTSKPLEPPINIYERSPKSTKKRNKKKKGQLSSSSSETEELIDVTKINANIDNNDLKSCISTNLKMDNDNAVNIVLKSSEYQKNESQIKDEVGEKQLERITTHNKEGVNKNTQSQKEFKVVCAENAENAEHKKGQKSEVIQQKFEIPKLKSNGEKKKENISKVKSVELKKCNIVLDKETFVGSPMKLKSCNEQEHKRETNITRSSTDMLKISKHENINQVKSTKVIKSPVTPSAQCNKATKSDTECCQKSRHDDVLDGGKIKETVTLKLNTKVINVKESEKNRHIIKENVVAKRENLNLTKIKAKKDKSKKPNEEEVVGNQKEKDSSDKDNILVVDSYKLINKSDTSSIKKEDKESSPKEDEKQSSALFIIPKKMEMEKEKPIEEMTKEVEEYVKKETVKIGKSKEIVIEKKAKDKESLTVSSNAWQTLSSAEMISKSLNDHDMSRNFHKFKECLKRTTSENLLPELLPTFKDINLKDDKTKRSQNKLIDFPNLESLPPLPTLQSLELLTKETKNSSTHKEISLINFESPSKEDPIEFEKYPEQQKQEQNGRTISRNNNESSFIQVMGASLHYENEHQQRHYHHQQQQQQQQQQDCYTSPQKVDYSPTVSSSNRSSSALEEMSIADYKSLTENDEAFMSLEKYSSSPNSSVSEEQKKTRKQKRRKQQEQHNKRYERHHHQQHHHQNHSKQQQQLQQQQQQQHFHHDDGVVNIDDEELQPLISEMAISQCELNPKILDADDDDDDDDDEDDEIKKLSPLRCPTPNFMQSTTDSDGPVPATTTTTTSDNDNVITLPAVAATAGNKIKTKKLEHKINLIAAIEAATSSSSSSAEESGIEIGNGRYLVSHNDNDFLVPVHGVMATAATPLTTTETAIRAITARATIPILTAVAASGATAATSTEEVQTTNILSSSSSPTSVPLISTAAMAAQSGVIKKKTKRRRR